ncbi:MAG: DUF998 domain-containing protein [Mucilaginibacter sp.]
MDKRETVAGVTATRTPLQTSLLCCGLLGTVLLTISYFFLGAITPGYDFFRQPIGDLELTKYGWIQSVTFVIVGLLSFAFAVGLRKELHKGFGITVLPLCYLLIGMGLITEGIFTHQPVNGIARLTVFVFALITFFLFTRRFAADPKWKGWATFTLFSAALMILLFLTFHYLRYSGSSFTGIFERLSIVVRMIWVIPFTMTLLDGRSLSGVE